MTARVKKRALKDLLVWGRKNRLLFGRTLGPAGRSGPSHDKKRGPPPDQRTREG